MRTAVIALAVVLFQSAAPRPEVALPAESEGWDAVVAGLLSTFDNGDVLMLGEAHGRAEDAELRLRLVRHPLFPEKARFIVMETLPADRQSLIDRYVDGGQITDAERQVFGGPTIASVVDTVRDVNMTLPASRRLRVLGAGVSGVSNGDRNAAAAAVIENEVLARGGKALVVFGSGHVWHVDGGVTTLLQRTIPGRVFVAEAIVDRGEISPRNPAPEASRRVLDAFALAMQGREGPVLLNLSLSPLGRLLANPFYGGQAMLPDSTTLGDIDDAVIYFDARRTSASSATAAPRFSAATDLVELMVTVTDRDGRFVTGLQAGDFAISEDGRPQQLSLFSAVREPVSLGIMIDASGSMAASGMNAAKLDYAKASVTRLVTQSLAPEDEFFVVWFGYNASLSLEWTTDRTRLRQALRDIDRPTGDTRLWDAVDFALPSAQTGLHRKRALLILSDGRDTRSSIRLEDLRRTVIDSDVLIYAVAVEGDTPATRGEGVDANALRRLTDDTGGRTEVVRGYGRLDEAMARLAAELGAQYHLAYTPTESARAGWRPVSVEVRGRPGVRVRTRAGYAP